jgi:hypothetical protein
MRNEVDTFGLIEVVEIKEVLGYSQGDVPLLQPILHAQRPGLATQIPSMPNFKLAYAEKIRQLAGPACCRAENQEDTQ